MTLLGGIDARRIPSVSRASNPADKRFATRRDAWIAVGLAILCAALYLRTMAPDIVNADGGEFQFAAWTFSLAHPTGYPLFLVLGGLFQHLIPISTPAFRLNLFTLITAAAAVGTLYLAMRGLGVNAYGSALGSTAFALTTNFWFDAGGAEVYDLNAFFIALLILLALHWRANSTTVRMALFAFAAGLALTHHRSILLWTPGFALFFLLSSGTKMSRQNWDWRAIGVVAAAFLLPLTLYLYVPLRGPSTPYASLALTDGQAITVQDNSVAGYVDHILGTRFQGQVAWGQASIARLTTVPAIIVDEFHVLGTALGLIGLVALVKRTEWAELSLLVAGLLGTAAFAALYQIGDIVHYYIPAHLVWSVFIAVAASDLIRFVAGSARIGRWKFGSVLVLAAGTVFLVVPAVEVVSHYRRADRSEENLRQFWSEVLSDQIPANAILVSNDRDDMMPMWYIQYVEEHRRDLLGLFPLITLDAGFANVVQVTDSALKTGRPVFLIKSMPGIEAKYDLETEAQFYKISTQVVEHRPQFASSAALADQVRLVGYDVDNDKGNVGVSLYWQPVVPLRFDYVAFVHLLDSSGNKVAQGEDHVIGGVYYPSSLWRIGELLRDKQYLPVSDLKPGSYRLIAGMYRNTDMEPLGSPGPVGTIILP